ncbi:hypothetical protein K4F52_010291 [Lecanicillium sp. MT-2017a]|nr:hypothetical protein K4F52_010291 [Lecanicillium sp. MT-2017a]
MDTSVLQSSEHRDLLDIVDRLRRQGFSNYVALPEIVVCGDQSAGKSSVLEALSRKRFPTKDSLCTRFPTELILRRHPLPGLNISIIPGPERSPEERESLGRFGVEYDAEADDIEVVVEKAKAAMGLSDVKVFSTDILRMEFRGPNQPNLTLVDLPGLFRAGNREQSVKDAAVVRAMVRDYLKRPRSIILAVVSAKSDFALQEITELARELDPRGVRTLGLITKPDTLDAGSDSEAAYLKLAQNRDVKLELGWHVLKNRSYDTRGATSAQRDESEAQFFRSGVWARVDAKHVGVLSLRPRLSNVLREQILQQLPSLLHDVASEMDSCSAELQRLGAARSTVREQRRYLLQVSREFTTLMQAAVDGEYNNAFFGSAKTDEGARRRLRARIQNALEHFAENMRLNGQRRVLLDELPDTDDNRKLTEREILRSDYIEDVKQLIRKSRGRELPGTFNPLIITELFVEQCAPWAGIVDDVKRDVLQAVDEVTGAIVSHVAADDTVPGILSVISRAGAKFKTALDLKIDELLEPHLKGHPITYNHYLTDTVQKAQEERRCRKMERAFADIVGRKKFSTGAVVDMSCSDLFKHLKTDTQVDMQLYASEVVTDYMEAYYKVACKKFVDDISVLAVENCEINKLTSLFHAEVVLDLDDDEVIRLAQESDDAADRRSRCIEKLAVLEAGKDDLKRLEAHRSLITGPRISEPDDDSDSAVVDFSCAGDEHLRTDETQPTEAGTDMENKECALSVETTVAEEVKEYSSADSIPVFTVSKKSKKAKKKIPSSSMWD